MRGRPATVHHLQGILCHELDTNPHRRRPPVVIALLANVVTNKDQVRDSVVSFAERAAESGSVQVFITTDRIRHGGATAHGAASSTFMSPTADSRAVVAAAI